MTKSKDIQIIPFKSSHLESYLDDDWVLDLVVPTEEEGISNGEVGRCQD